jgi:iron complex transport system ATP-binding protein
MIEATALALPGRLQPTDLRLQSGELACLIGPNGSGKTSLLHALAGIGHPAGEVRIDGVEPKRLAPAQRQRLLAFLPASHDVAWPVTARDLVALGLPDGADQRRITELLDALELGAMASRRMDRLSTGERSRVLIARALAARPRLLLLDEPASNLDPLWQLKLMAYLRAEAVANGQALLVAVHDLDLARDFADRLIVMAEGHIVADDAPEPILAGPVLEQVFGIRRDGWRWQIA